MTSACGRIHYILDSSASGGRLYYNIFYKKCKLFCTVRFQFRSAMVNCRAAAGRAADFLSGTVIFWRI